MDKIIWVVSYAIEVVARLMFTVLGFTALFSLSFFLSFLVVVVLVAFDKSLGTVGFVVFPFLGLCWSVYTISRCELAFYPKWFFFLMTMFPLAVASLTPRPHDDRFLVVLIVAAFSFLAVSVFVMADLGQRKLMLSLKERENRERERQQKAEGDLFEDVLDGSDG